MSFSFSLSLSLYIYIYTAYKYGYEYNNINMKTAQEWMMLSRLLELDADEDPLSLAFFKSHDSRPFHSYLPDGRRTRCHLKHNIVFQREGLGWLAGQKQLHSLGEDEETCRTGKFCG